MGDLRLKDGAPLSETLRTRQLATFRGRDCIECACAVMFRDADDLRWWNYREGERGESYKRWMFRPHQTCSCHGSGWVCATCGGASWVQIENDKGRYTAQRCPQCTADGAPNDWSRALAMLRETNETKEVEYGGVHAMAYAGGAE